MSETRFRGLYPILHTPFDDRGEVDFDSLRRLVTHVADCRTEGAVFPGFASEFWKLSDAEILACAECIAGSAAGRLRIVFNVTAQSTPAALSQVRPFARLRPQALMVLPPFVVPPPAPAIEEHLGAVLEATPLPCILQDSAGLTGTRLDPAMVARLKRRQTLLTGLKVDQVPTGPAISRYRAVSELHELSYLVGYSGVQMLDAVRRGAEGLMGGCGHLLEDRRMLDAVHGPDEGHAYREFARLAPLLNFEMQSLDLVISVHKSLLYDAGVIATPLSRAPSAALDEVHASELRLHLAALGR